jgi:hypothetical protein
LGVYRPARSPENTGINYGGLDGLQPAVLLSSKVRPTLRKNWGCLIGDVCPNKKKSLNGQWCGNRAQILFGRCGSFVEPVVVIPDIGGAANEYFVVKNRDAWKQDFEEWLETSNPTHIYDV